MLQPRRIATISGFLVALSACSILQPAHYVTRENPIYDPDTQARIRVAASNASETARFWRESSCQPPLRSDLPNLVRVDDSWSGAFKNSTTSISIGMPPSPREWMRPEGLKFKDFFKEYVVSSGKPLTVSLLVSQSNYIAGCKPPSVTFTPESGKDYDIFMDGAGRQCWVAVRRIDERGTDAPVNVQRALTCPDSDAVGARN
jgi:hypothetical protein